MFQFQNPLILLLFLSFPALIIFYIKAKNKREASISFSSLKTLKSITKMPSVLARHSLFALRIFTISMLIIASSRPQAGKKNSEIVSEGLNIQLVLDNSGSMIGEDFRPTRMESAKRVINQFITDRKHDRIGLVVFSTEAFVKCPLTLDYGVLGSFLKQVHPEREGSTAIGLGLATAVSALKDIKGKSKIVILLTDGDNNAGEISPITAAEIANTYDIKVYTIGIGKAGTHRVWVTVDHPIAGKIKQHVMLTMNDSILKQIASITGGRYFNAENDKALEEVYQTIDKLEKVKIREEQFMEYNELYTGFLIAALLAILLEIILAGTRLRKIP